MLTQEEAISLLNYDPVTGIVRWKINGHSVYRGKLVNSTSTTGHMNVTINRKRIQLSHVIWLITYGKWPVHEVDHINGIPGDNRIVNLRECTKSQNQANRGLFKTREAASEAYNKKGRELFGEFHQPSVVKQNPAKVS